MNEYPEVDYELSFPDNRYARAYRDASMFNKIVHGIDDLISATTISADEYGELYPLFVFDVSKQQERLKVSTVGIRIEARFKINISPSTQAYAVIISDCICQFKSNGSQLSLIK